MGIRKELSSAQITNADYGECLTDIPSKTTGENYVRYIRHDYIHGGEYNRFAMELLSDLEMELPQKSRIYRGRHEDILFLDRYGLTVRVGEIDVADFINPAILQPLSWVSTNGLVIAVYPGIRHQEFNCNEFEDYEELCCSNSTSTTKTINFLIDSFQKANDVQNVNVGLVKARVGEFVGDVPMLFDVNDEDNLTLDDDLRRVKQGLYQVDVADRPKAMMKMMDSLYSNVRHWDVFLAGQHTSHPLRQELADALAINIGAHRRYALKQFFEHCERLLQRPEGLLSLHADWSCKPSMS